MVQIKHVEYGLYIINPAGICLIFLGGGIYMYDIYVIYILKGAVKV